MTRPAEPKGIITIDRDIIERFKRKEAPPGYSWYQIGEQTLEGIANIHGWRLEDLFIHNWKTTRIEEINRYLRLTVGCKTHENGSYVFTGTESPGRILVPKVDGFAISPTVSAACARDDKNTCDTALQVMVFEALPESVEEVSGKWLYVFSGDGVDFGYQKTESMFKGGSETGKEDEQPGSAHSEDFIGFYHLDPSKQPNKLEHEIFISPKDPPKDENVKIISALDSTDKSKIKYNHTWHFHEPVGLTEKAKTEPRRNRTNYNAQAFRTVPIDLSQNKRFYFLLSPVKLGPAAIDYAMKNPNGLTPLLKHNTKFNNPAAKKKDEDDDGIVNNQAAFDANVLKENVGPTHKDVKYSPIVLGVIDPYAWAKYIASKMLPNKVEEYKKWGEGEDSTENQTIAKLKEATKWTPEHFHVAEVFKSVSDSYPEKHELELKLKKTLSKEIRWKDEILGKETVIDNWKGVVSLWEREIHDKNASLLAHLDYTLTQLIKWLAGPAHIIIETAILKDTELDNPDDAATISAGLTHWAICIENMFTMEPGISYLSYVLTRSGNVAYDMLFKPLNDLDKTSAMPDIKPAVRLGWRYSNLDFLLLPSLRDFVLYQSPVNSSGTLEEKRKSLEAYLVKKRDNLIKVINKYQILPGEAQAVPISLDNSAPLDLATGLTALATTVDLVDKQVSLITFNPQEVRTLRRDHFKKLIDMKKEGMQLTPEAAEIDVILHENNSLSQKRVFWIGKSVAWTYKTLSTGVTIINLVNFVTAVRYAYQNNKSIPLVNWINTIAGVIVTIQDVFNELGEIIKLVNKKPDNPLLRAFPALTEIKTGKSGYPVFSALKAKNKWMFGYGIVNIVAQLAVGITTIIMMNESQQKAKRSGAYLAATYYRIGMVGGAVVTAGAAAWGLAFFTAGTTFTGSGLLAPVGVALMFIGGLIILFASIFGGKAESNAYQLFAHKFFLGEGANQSNLFGDDIPKWSHFEKGKKWSIGQQKRAIYNLLGMFTLKTTVTSIYTDERTMIKEEAKGIFQGYVEFTITPGLIIPGTTVDVELYYEGSSQKSAVILEWIGPPAITPFNSEYTLREHKGGIFAADKTQANFYFSSDAVKYIFVKAEDVKFEVKRGSDKPTKLMADVIIRYPGLENVISIKNKEVMSFDEGKYNTDKDNYQLTLKLDTETKNEFD